MDMNITQSADEVIERLGAAAIEYINTRILKLERDGMGPDVDRAYRLLTEVERLIRGRA